MNCQHTNISPSARLELISTVSNSLFQATESWSEIGEQLSYLLWAIADNSFVDWKNDSPGSLKPLMKKVFAPEHSVWKFIAR